MNHCIGFAVCLLLAVSSFKAAANPGGKNYANVMVVFLKFLSVSLLQASYGFAVL